MPRTHIINPTVTVIMDTVGGHPDKIAGAIRSFLAQDYPFCKLVIFNRHPSPLIVHGIPDDWRMRVEIVNQEDTYTRLVYQYIWNLQNVRTDCWTILDDDDTIEPGHISQLVAHWNRCTDRNDSPLQVCGRNYTVHYEDRIVPLSFRGWGVSLFERLTPDEVTLCFKNFPPDVIIGPDTWIAWNTYFDKREFEGAPSYHWDRTGLRHLSAHETNRGETPRERFAMTANYWRIKLAARDSVLEPVQL